MVFNPIQLMILYLKKTTAVFAQTEAQQFVR